MASFSTHVLDAVSGRSAAGVRIVCVRRLSDGGRHEVFDVVSDGEGRVAEPVQVAAGEGGHEYELVFHTGDYFDAQPNPSEGRQIMRTVVIRITMPDPQARYHIPVIAGPHSYSVWWSA